MLITFHSLENIANNFKKHKNNVTVPSSIPLTSMATAQRDIFSKKTVKFGMQSDSDSDLDETLSSEEKNKLKNDSEYQHLKKLVRNYEKIVLEPQEDKLEEKRSLLAKTRIELQSLNLPNLTKLIKGTQISQLQNEIKTLEDEIEKLRNDANYTKNFQAWNNRSAKVLSS
jgi:hypothetical protein